MMNEFTKFDKNFLIIFKKKTIYIINKLKNGRFI